MKKRSAFDSIGPVDPPPPWADLAVYGLSLAVGGAVAVALFVALWVMT